MESDKNWYVRESARKIEGRRERESERERQRE